jgi:hypothetical protein
MSSVQFEEEDVSFSSDVLNPEKGLVQLIIKTGIAENEQQAVRVLFGIVGVCIVITGFLIVKSLRDTSAVTQPPAELTEQLKNIPLNQSN